MWVAIFILFRLIMQATILGVAIMITTIEAFNKHRNIYWIKLKMRNTFRIIGKKLYNRITSLHNRLLTRDRFGMQGFSDYIHTGSLIYLGSVKATRINYIYPSMTTWEPQHRLLLNRYRELINSRARGCKFFIDEQAEIRYKLRKDTSHATLR